MLESKIQKFTIFAIQVVLKGEHSDTLSSEHLIKKTSSFVCFKSLKSNGTKGKEQDAVVLVTTIAALGGIKRCICENLV